MTKCTFYDATTGEIEGSGIVSDDTLDGYVTNGTPVILDIEASEETHYVQLDPLEIVAYTAGELAFKNALPKGWVWRMPDRIAVDMRSVASARAAAWVRIKAARDVAEVADFTCDGNHYQANRDRINEAVTDAIMAQLAGTPYLNVWTLSDNTTLTLDGPQMMAIGAALAQRNKAIFATSVALREEIAAVTDSPTANAELDAINWPSEE